MKPDSSRFSFRLLSGMTRIEMLITLYERAIHHARQMQQSLETNNQSGANFHRWKCQKFINGLHAGVVDDGSELTTNLIRLFEFSAHQISEGRTDAAIRILEMLRDGWAAIREQANVDEANGIIPSLDVTATGMEVAV